MRIVVPHAQGVTARDMHECRMEEGAVVQQLPVVQMLRAHARAQATSTSGCVSVTVLCFRATLRYDTVSYYSKCIHATV